MMWKSPFCPEHFLVENVPAFDISTMWRVLVIAILCAIASMLFCWAMHRGEKLFKKLFKNEFLRAAVGGIVVILDFARSPFSKSNIKAYKQLKQIIETNHYDIIHCHTPVAADFRVKVRKIFLRTNGASCLVFDSSRKFRKSVLKCLYNLLCCVSCL